MKSIILNLRNDIEAYSNYAGTNAKYTNLVSSDSTIVPISRNPETGAVLTNLPTILTNYPVSNLLDDYSITSELRTNTVTEFSGDYRRGGITISFDATKLAPEQLTFNTVYVNINKLNKEFIKSFDVNHLASSGVTQYSYNISFRRKSNPSVVVKYFRFTNTDSCSVSGSYIDYVQNFHEGNILIDPSLIVLVDGTDTLVSADWFIDFSVRLESGTPLKIIDFSVSNIFVGNAIEFLVDEGLTYVKNNLDEVINSKRVGKTFRQINEYEKNLQMTFDLLKADEVLSDIYNFIIYNKSCPLVVFPFSCYINGSVASDFAENPLKRFNKQSMEQGGMYFISKDLTLKHKKYDVYSFSLDLKEHK